MSTSLQSVSSSTAGEIPPDGENAWPASRPNWIDRYPFRAFALLTLFYAVATAALSYVKLLWLDELITLHIAQLGSAKAIWHALSRAADPNPPLTHLAVLASMRIFGAHTYVYRLPAMVGYWLGMLAVFLLLKRRVPATWALLGAVLSMGMRSFEWSFESRSYALFFGTTLMALFCYSGAVAEKTSRGARWLAAVGVAVLLAAGLCTNYFSVLAFVPIITGEAVRAISASRLTDRRGVRGFLSQVNRPVVLALCVGGTPLLVFHKVIQQSIALYQPYAWNKVSFDLTNVAYLEMVEAMLWPLGILMLLCAGVIFLRSFCNQCRAGMRPRWLGRFVTAARPRSLRAPAPRFEIAAVFMLLIYPYLGWALASLHGGMLASRFLLPMCGGFALAAAYLTYRSLGQIRSVGPVLLAGFLLWFMVRESYVGFSYDEQKTALFTTFAALREVDHTKEPIVVSDNLLLLPFQHYAPPDVASRVVEPMDIAAIMNRRGEASSEVNLWHGRQLYGFPIMPLAFFQRSVVSYLMVASEPDWLLDDLHAHHYYDDVLPVDTHAEPLNWGPTPLSHAKPEIIRVYGDKDVLDFPEEPLPKPFSVQGELPTQGP